MLRALVGADIFDGDRVLKNRAVVMCDDSIWAVLPANQLPEEIVSTELAGGILAPGFIDLQVNGGGGKLFNNDPSLDAIKAMLEGHRNFGTTSMMPTLISDTTEKQVSAIGAVRHAIDTYHTGVLGVHMEGPFFSHKRRGTHRADYLRNPEMNDIQWLIEEQNKASDMTMLVTLAPEHMATGQIKMLADAGIIVCAGHTDAHHQEIEMALTDGLRGFTHLYNAMRPLTARDPGVVGTALSDADSWCGIIADGHHVHPIAIKIAIAAKPTGKVFLVSDAMATVGSVKKHFTLYDERIQEQGGQLINSEKRLAGSAIGMIDAVRFCVEEVGTSLEEALRMASLYPAQFIAKDHCLGRIQGGYRADLVHFNSDYKVVQTWVAGGHK